MYHNVPMDPETGPEAIKYFIAGFKAAFDGKIVKWSDYFDMATVTKAFA